MTIGTPSRVALPPTLVAALRGLLIAAVTAGADALLGWVVGVDAKWLVPLQPAIVAVARALEGWVLDELRGQAPQAGVLGGAPADPAAYVDTAPITALVDSGPGPADLVADHVATYHRPADGPPA